MKITVQVKRVYGNDTIYPVCEQAKIFARIANTTSLTRSAIKDIKALGYSVEIQQPEFTI